METSDKTLINSVIRMLDTLTTDNTQYDTLINVLALLCVLSIVNRPQSKAVAAAAPSTSDNPIQKILGQLTKGEDGNAPDMLMSLLPLLNNPQLKSKLNPANISSILGLINNLGGASSEKSSPKQDKAEKNSKPETAPSPAPVTHQLATEPPAALVAHTENSEPAAPNQGDVEKRVSRSLNWKSNF